MEKSNGSLKKRVANQIRDMNGESEILKLEAV
jgi:hypothetical protein